METDSKRLLKGWHLAGTDRWWPAMFGEPPFFDRWDWRPIHAR